MSYADPFDPTTPVGSTTPANQIDESIRLTKRGIKQRLDDVTGADWQADDPIEPSKYGPAVTIQEKQVGQAQEFNNGNSGSAPTIDWNNGNYQRISLNANCTLTLSNPIVTTYVLRVINTGSFTLTFPTLAEFPNNSPLQPTANRDTVYTFYWNGSYYNVGVLGAGYQP